MKISTRASRTGRAHVRVRGTVDSGAELQATVRRGSRSFGRSRSVTEAADGLTANRLCHEADLRLGGSRFGTRFARSAQGDHLVDGCLSWYLTF